MQYCTTLHLSISHTVWDVHLNPAAWGYHTAWASAHLIPVLGFHPWILVHLLCITQALVTNVQYICKFPHQIIIAIAKKKSFHALASHTSPGNIMGCAFDKKKQKQQDVGIREEVGGNERNELVMLLLNMCCWSVVGCGVCLYVGDSI